MPTSLRIHHTGGCCTVQDAGRRGFLRAGVSRSGPMDWVSHRLANRLAGRPPDSPAIEVSIGGIEIEAVGGEVVLGLAGGAFAARCDRVPVAHPAAIRLAPSQRLSITTGRSGAWLYVAPSLVMDIDAVMGSSSTHVRYRIGPNEGRTLQPGDTIRLRGAPSAAEPCSAIHPYAVLRDAIRVVLGPQHEMFAAEDIGLLLASPFQLSNRCDRMAYVLEGPLIQPERTYDIVTDATALGTIQGAGDGSLYVLMADRPSTGGYPKIATICRVDIGRFAQLRPGEAVRFESIGVAEATGLLAETRRAIDEIATVRPGCFDLEALREGDKTGLWNALAET